MKLIISCCLISCIAASQCKDYYWNDNGKLRFGKREVKISGNKYRIHPNPSYLTRWDDSVNDLFGWTISFCGSWIFNPFKNTRYDPVEAEFQMTGQYHGRDREFVFLRDIVDEGDPHGPPSYTIKFIIMEGADLNTFEELKEDVRYGKDKNKVYFEFWEMEGADPNTFVILSSQFKTEKRELKLRQGQKIMFETGAGISKDKDHVFWNQYIMEDVVPQDFELIGNNTCLWKGKQYFIESFNRLRLKPDSK